MVTQARNSVSQKDRQKLQRTSFCIKSSPLTSKYSVTPHLRRSVTINAATQAQITEIASKFTIILSFG